MSLDILKKDALELLKKLISTQSFSREEDRTADIVNDFLTQRGVETQRLKNNVWAYNKYYDPSKPTVLLNSHHDTVKPNPGYTRNPYSPDIEDGKLYGLGSNDAGGCLVALICTFCYFYDKKDLRYNFCIAATAEEEVSGRDGLELVFPLLHPISFAIVGEPTFMDAAVAEKGLMVLDCTAVGKAGHAAREEGINSIYIAMQDIEWVKNYRFDKVSPHLGPVKMTVTIINAGSQHNVVPKECVFTIDVRVTEQYENEEVLEIIRRHLQSEVTPRSIRLRPSFIDISHPFIQTAIKLGAKTYGSPTTSDQAVLPTSLPSVKMGPGDSGRSHMADEWIYVHEVEEGLERYIKLLSEICL